MNNIINRLFFWGLLLFMGCSAPTSIIDQIDFDEQALIEQADVYLKQEPITITAFPAERSEGGLHDFYSEGPYWWENPDDPDGPYIRRDGERNPSNFSAHDDAMVELHQIITTLVAAYQLSKDEKYAEQALTHLQAWFVHEDTKMTPHLLYGQAIKGIVSGRGIGLIDMVPLIEIALGIVQLRQSGFLKDQEMAPIKDWFEAFAGWMTTHPYGIDERDHGNNHSTWWAAQIAAYARVTENPDLLNIAQQQFKKILPEQMEADGTFPRELARTKPYHYTIYNLDAWTRLALLASTEEENLWEYQSEKGSLRTAINFFVPFMKDKSAWSLPPDVTGFQEQPQRSDFLIFAAMGYQETGYFDLWKKLGDDEPSRAYYLLMY